jgi:hypothetical protein
MTNKYVCSNHNHFISFKVKIYLVNAAIMFDNTIEKQTILDQIYNSRRATLSFINFIRSNW